MQGLLSDQDLAALAPPQGPAPLPMAPAPQANPLAGLAPELPGIADTSMVEAQKYAKQAESQMKKANRWNTVSNILNFVGGLASTANQFYQASQGRQGLAIGAPLQQTGVMLQQLKTAPAQDLYEKAAAKSAVSQIPNLDPTVRQGLMASVDAGQKEAGFKGLFETIKNQNKQGELDVAFVTGKWPDGRPVSPQEMSQIAAYRELGRTNITISPEQTNRAGYMKTRALEIQKQLNDPFSNINVVKTPEAAAQRSSLQNELSQIQSELNLPVPGASPTPPKPDGLGPKTKKPKAGGAPAGAVAKAPGSDGKFYYIDAKGQKLGPAQ